MRAKGPERTLVERPLPLDTRDRATLVWVRDRSRAWKTRMKRRRKYAVPRGAGFGPEEAKIFGALLDVERGSRGLLETLKMGKTKEKPHE